MGAVAYEESQEPIRRYRSINFSKAESLFRASSANEKHEWITSRQNQRVAASLEHRLARSSPTQPHAANCRQSRTRRSSSRLPAFSLRTPWRCRAESVLGVRRNFGFGVQSAIITIRSIRHATASVHGLRKQRDRPMKITVTTMPSFRAIHLGSVGKSLLSEGHWLVSQELLSELMTGEGESCYRCHFFSGRWL